MNCILSWNSIIINYNVREQEHLSYCIHYKYFAEGWLKVLSRIRGHSSDSTGRFPVKSETLTEDSGT